MWKLLQIILGCNYLSVKPFKITTYFLMQPIFTRCTCTFIPNILVPNINSYICTCQTFISSNTINVFLCWYWNHQHHFLHYAFFDHTTGTYYRENCKSEKHSHLYEKYDINSVQAALLLAMCYMVEQRGFIASCVNSTGL